MKADLKTLRTLLGGKPAKQKPRKNGKKRSLGERLLEKAVGQILAVVKSKWDKEIWKPDP